MKNLLNRILGRERTIVGFKILVVKTTSKVCVLRLWKKYENGDVVKSGKDIDLFEGDTLTLGGKEQNEQKKQM